MENIEFTFSIPGDGVKVLVYHDETAGNDSLVLCIEDENAAREVIYSGGDVASATRELFDAFFAGSLTPDAATRIIEANGLEAVVE